DGERRCGVRSARAAYGEGLVHLLASEDRGRLDEYQELGTAIENFEDLDALLKPERNVLDAGSGLDRDRETLLEPANALLYGPVVEDRTAALIAEDDVLGNGERRHEHEVLVDHPDAERDGVARSCEDRKGVV